MELNIRISEEEIHQSIEDVKKQNNLTQEALVAALASQGLSFDQYRAQLQEQLEKLKLVTMEVRSKIQVGESEMRGYYDANLAKYTEDETFLARHVFFRTSEKAPAEDIKRTMTTALMVLAEAKERQGFYRIGKNLFRGSGSKQGWRSVGAV